MRPHQVTMKRVQDFRAKNTVEKTILNFFDEMECHPYDVNVETSSNAFDEMITSIGVPHNYGPTIDELLNKRRVLLKKRVSYLYLIKGRS